MLFLVVRLMATHAVGLVQRVEDGRASVGGMAVRARQLLMGSGELEPTGYQEMIEVLRVPCSLAMTEQAGGGVSGSRVFTQVVRLMAGNAVLFTLGNEDEPPTLGVACAAWDIPVGTLEPISPGKLRVVDGPDVPPCLGSVTGQTIRRKPEGDVIHVLWALEIVPMAGQAVRGKWAETSPFIVGVTALTAELQVGSIKGKPGPLVDVQTRDVFEGGWRMA